MSRVIFTLGLLIALTASALLVAGVIESGVAALLGIVGISLIAASRRMLHSQDNLRAQSEKIVQTIYSPDRYLRALIKQRSDGKYQIEIQKFVHDYSPDVGSHDRWERQSNASITDTLASAVEIAASSVGAGTVDFFDKDA